MEIRKLSPVEISGLKDEGFIQDDIECINGLENNEVYIKAINYNNSGLLKYKKVTKRSSGIMLEIIQEP
jgi:hypothetical protein